MATIARPATAADGRSVQLGIRGARSILAAATLAVGAAVVAAVLLFRPWPVRNSFVFGEIAPIRDGIWTSIFVDSLAFAAVAIGLALVVSQLTPARGGALANLGAIVVTLGGVLFAMGAFAFAAFAWYVTDPAVLPAADGARLLDYAVANPEHVMIPQALGFLLYTLGTVVLALALVRARTVPRWLPIAVIGLTIAQFIAHDRLLDLVQVATMATLVILAAMAVRFRRSAHGDARAMWEGSGADTRI